MRPPDPIPPPRFNPDRLPPSPLDMSLEEHNKLLREALERIALMWPETSGPVSNSFRQVARDALGPACPECGCGMRAGIAFYSCLNCGGKTGVGPGPIEPGMVLADAARALRAQLPDRAEVLIAALEREMSLGPRIRAKLGSLGRDFGEFGSDYANRLRATLNEVRELVGLNKEAVE